MKINFARVSFVLGICMIVSYSIAGFVACTSLHDCQVHYKDTDLLKENTTIPLNITELEIETVSHDVIVQIGSEPQGKITFDNTTYKNDNGSVEKELVLDVNVNKNQMSAVVRYLHTHRSHSYDGERRLVLNLPQGFKGTLKINTVSGSISVAPIKLASCKFSSTSGDLEANKLNCQQTELYTTSGDYQVNNLVADDFKFVSTSGDGTFADLSVAEKINLTSVSGEIVTNIIKLPRKEIEGSTISGDLIFKLPADAKLNIDFKTTSGDIKSKFPIITTQTTLNRNEVSGVIGGTTKNGTMLKVETVSSDVELNQ